MALFAHWSSKTRTGHYAALPGYQSGFLASDLEVA